MANKIYYGTGHRKSSIAKVRMTSGKGNITINGRDVNEYLPFPTLVMDLKQPLEATNTLDKFDINVDSKRWRILRTNWSNPFRNYKSIIRI